jgi:DNA-binding response OmpR family regulator
MLSKTPSARKMWAISSPAGRLHTAARELSTMRREVFPSPALLVVSTDGLLRWALYEGLVAAGFRVLTGSDEAHTRDILAKIDLDITLAIVDGESWPMTRETRDLLRERWPHLPIILLAHPGDGLEERVKELEVGVLMKPFDLPHLIETVSCTIAAAAHHTIRGEPVQAG